jgi:hypothetical protein
MHGWSHGTLAKKQLFKGPIFGGFDHVTINPAPMGDAVLSISKFVVTRSL